MVPELGEDRGQLDAHAVPPFVAVPSAVASVPGRRHRPGSLRPGVVGGRRAATAGPAPGRGRRRRRPGRPHRRSVPLARAVQPRRWASRRPIRDAPRAHALAGAPVVEPGQDPRDLLEGRHVSATAGRLHRLPGAQVVDELLGRPDGLVVEELPVGHDDRGVVAGRVALDALEGDLPVRRRLVVADAEVVADGVPDRVAAHDRAERVGADADGVLAVGVPLVLRVERRDAADLGGLEVELLRAEGDPAAGDEAVDRSGRGAAAAAGPTAPAGSAR